MGKSFTKLIIIGLSVIVGASSAYANETSNKNITVRFSTLLKNEIAQVHNKHKPLTTISPVFYYDAHSNIMSFADSKRQARALAQANRAVYYLLAGQTVRETINRWGALNNYKVIYQTDVNFTVNQTTPIYGKFLSKNNGALAQLLNSLKSTDHPIKAEVKSNHVILIQPDQFNADFLAP